MSIHTVQAQHYPELITVWEASVRASHDFLSETHIAHLRDLILNHYFAQVTLRAWQDEAGRCLGFVGVAAGNIEMLFVHPHAQGLGIGKALVSHALTHLGADKVDVNEQNPQATAFYQHMGFVICGRSDTDGQGWPFPLLHMQWLQPADRK
ncbi:GNAT family N-acetyltransferase [Vitreoscilla massiliensis]|uniref:GNAT family N-acetyltransferase n=1 Tax=Vitreoscilla massiliensis TaxID=1689272 RepID=A0ABY4E119_9NEIS|nr:GNAT family N-acetyltransferase [Vitreoscilla massiliensis]UOO89046.1 GNAT family N-acetyltransferase [Vitreoscilla massiliensis]